MNLSIATAQRERGSCYEELPINQISDYPLLDACYRLWRDGCNGKQVPARLDPVELPRQILPTVFLLDLERSPTRLRIRLAGTAICERHGRELRGLTPEEFFDPEDARRVTEVALDAASTRRPSLARRSFVTMDDRLWTYTRLMLPLARGGGAVDSFFKAADPASMQRIV
ncbi:MAG: PAS domain-containing protein [Tistlia sp.]|uniref:PAS domain-containing protein n=1 Tax=Tistlia sp. TaxID=3057121 RepID=UPI0034A23143